MSIPFATALRVEHLINPLALDEPAPRFSWKLVDPRTGAAQSAFQIEVSSNGETVWNSGRVPGAACVLVPYEGPGLAPHTRYHWRVRLWDHARADLGWSQPAWFETGFLAPDAPWPAAEWIAHPDLPKAPANRPAAELRKKFTLAATPKEARLYATARGLFEPHVNGCRIGADHMTPGWTDYRHRFEYLAYDVTAQLRAGENSLSLLLADGWYCGYMGWSRGRDRYGDTPAALAVVRLIEADGTERWIGTDSTWRASLGPIINADIYDGEYFDARRDFGKAAKPCAVLSFPRLPLTAKAFGRVRTMEELKTVRLTHPPGGCHIFDLGQNMVGSIRLRISAPRGTRVTIRYGEMLDKNGRLYTANYRSARSTDTYVCKGGRRETYSPRFTFHGFRYVEVSGLATKPRRDAITGLVWHTEMQPTGSFQCSDPLINQLQSNIRWGQKGNFLEIPTDCPQRDERLGWTGDAQVFIPTAAFNHDIAAFFRKWSRDLVDGQHALGAFPDIAPDVFFSSNGKNPKANAAWADAGIICPWLIYRKYGDTRILEENYPAMARYIGFLERTSRHLIRPDTTYGDWLAPDAARCDRTATPCDLIGTAYFARCTEILHKTARLLGRSSDAKRYAIQHKRLLRAFNREFVSPNARLAGDTQTAYLLALAFDLLPEKKRPAAIGHLERTLKRRDFHLSTGFVGTPLLCPVLSRFDRHDLAYRLLFQTDYPSWLLPVVNGATTMWEKWDSWTPDKGFGDAGMNSFNHYAYGAIGEWLYSTVAGINELEPAFKSILLRPIPHERLTRASASLDTPYGLVESSWKLSRGVLDWSVTIPPNTSAIAVCPAIAADAVLIHSRPWHQTRGVRAAKSHGPTAFSLVAGRYRLTFPCHRASSSAHAKA